MTDETIMKPAEAEITDPGAALEVVQDTLEVFLETASVDRVYGEPIQHGDTLIIPTAEVLAGLGFGAGYGSGDDKEGNKGGGGGGGGGGRTFSRPVAIIVSSPEGVRIEEVVDPTKIALAALTAAGFMMGMFLRMIGPKRGIRAIKNP